LNSQGHLLYNANASCVQMSNRDNGQQCCACGDVYAWIRRSLIKRTFI